MEHNNKFNMKNFIKIDAQATRLKSLRLPRDLSLGGTKIKKNYKPNLNVTRNKNEKLKELHKTSNRKKKAGGFNNSSGNVDRFLQSTGVFSEGIGINETCTPVATTTKKTTKVEIRKQLVNCKPSETPDVVTNSSNKLDVVDKVDTYATFKNEGTDNDDTDESIAPILWDKRSVAYNFASDVKDEIVDQFVLVNQNQSVPKLSLWQLPDSFSLSKEKEASTSRQDCKLKDIPQGNIGKMQIRKSGKVDVCIAGCKYEMDFASLGLHMEELMCIDVDNNNIAALGDIGNKFVVSPDWKFLLSVS